MFDSGRVGLPGLDLRDIAGRAAPVALASEQLLAVPDSLRSLFPRGGLRRGSVVGVDAASGAALALAVVSGPSQAGSWVAVVGWPALGAVAASEAGVDLARCALVTDPGPSWPTVVAALIDAIDVVALRAPERVRAADARRLSARVRERGSVLVVVGAWPEGPDVRLRVERTEWSGLGRGHGALTHRRLSVVGGGRGAAARERRATVVLP